MKPLHWYNISNAAAAVAEISIYGPIGGGFEGGVTARQFAEDLKAVTARQITLRIHSPGGNILEGHAIFNALQRHRATITTVVDGLCASMATVIALAGSRVKIAANGLWMIHNPGAETAGTSKDLRDLAGFLDKLAVQILDVYAAKTGKPREEISALMDAETWMNAEEAKAFGFVDEILPVKKASAAIAGDFDLSAFAHPPSAPHDRQKAIYEEYRGLAKDQRSREAAQLWSEHEADLTAYTAHLSAHPNPAPLDVALLRAELSARDNAILSMQSQVQRKDAEIAALTGQAKTTDQRAQELAASFGCIGATKDVDLAANAGNAAASRTMSRAQFGKLSPENQSAHCLNGGKITD